MNTPRIIPILKKLEFLDRFIAFCQPEITHATAAKWLLRETGCAYSAAQVQWARKSLQCAPKPGGKRPSRGTVGPVQIRGRRAA